MPSGDRTGPMGKVPEPEEHEDFVLDLTPRDISPAPPSPDCWIRHAGNWPLHLWEERVSSSKGGPM
jgi:hypothetical protein